jgi:N4-gp56 family major capsid protein
MKTIFERFNLQLFADGSFTVNTLTNGYINNQTGTQVDAGGNSLSAELKTFYDTELLENARIERYYGQFGMKKSLPANHGGTVEWRKFNTFKKADRLFEGVIPEAQKGGTTVVYGYIAQYGTFVAVTDILEKRAYDPIILGYTEEMGAAASETQETLIRDALIGHTSKFFCDNVKADGTIVKTPTGYADMGVDANGNAGMSTLTPTMVAKIVTHLKKKRVPTIGGKYVAVIHPSVSYDLRQSKEWIEAHKYAATTEIFNGEIGEIHGCRFIENPFAPVCGGELAPSGGRSYATMFFGKDAFGIIDPEQGGLEMIVKDKEQVGGPLNQFSTIGFKLETNGATILYPDRLVVAWSCSTYSNIDEATYDPTYYDVTQSPYYPKAT